MKTLIISGLLLFMPLVVSAQTDQAVFTASDEDNNRLAFIGQGEWQPGWITQTGESNSIIVLKDSLRIPLYLIRQYGNDNRALMVQISADSTGIENNQNRVRIKQKGKSNSATVIQHD